MPRLENLWVSWGSLNSPNGRYGVILMDLSRVFSHGDFILWSGHFKFWQKTKFINQVFVEKISPGRRGPPGYPLPDRGDFFAPEGHPQRQERSPFHWPATLSDVKSSFKKGVFYPQISPKSQILKTANPKIYKWVKQFMGGKVK